MDTMNSIKFVAGAISKRDVVPELTHFRLDDGTIRATDGIVTACAPIDVHLTALPHADTFTKAIKACKGSIAFHMTDAGRLAVKSGPFRAYVDCIDERPGYYGEPRGTMYEMPEQGGIVHMLDKLEPFMSEDAAHAWACGVRLDHNMALATNNIVAVQLWHGMNLPYAVTVPARAVKHLSNAPDPVTAVQVDDTSITFHFGPNYWLRTQVIAEPYRDIDAIIDRAHSAAYPVAITAEIFAAADKLRPFFDSQSRCYFHADKMATEAEDQDGASIDLVAAGGAQGIYNMSQLSKLKGFATVIDWTKYPDPVPFAAEAMRGCIMGILRR